MQPVCIQPGEAQTVEHEQGRMRRNGRSAARCVGILAGGVPQLAAFIAEWCVRQLKKPGPQLPLGANGPHTGVCEPVGPACA